MQIGRPSEEILAQAVPLTGGGREELLRLALAAAEHAAEPSGVLIGAGGQAHLLAQQRPEPPRRGPAVVERQACSSGSCRRGATRPIRRPSKRLQVAADRRLRQLQDGAELRDRELVALEHQQHAAAGGVGQSGQVVENCGFHPYIRMKCCTSAVMRSSAGGV